MKQKQQAGDGALLPDLAVVQTSDGKANFYTPRRAGAGRIDVGNYHIVNLWQTEERKEGEVVAADWRSFMHGLKDNEAYPLAWELSLGELQKSVLDDAAPVNLACKTSDMSAICLKGGESLILEKPVMDLDTLAKNRRQLLRFYIWMKGEGTGAGAALWDGAPQVSFYLKDANDVIVGNCSGLFWTRGTFPWHCYYVTMQIPATLDTEAEAPLAQEGADAMTTEADQNAALAKMIGIVGDEADDKDENVFPKGGGLYIKLNNPVAGKAWFSTLSWERVTAQAVDKEALADPVLGTFAPNADYDELPMHLFFGLSQKYTWNFLRGNKASVNLTQIAGLESYFRDYGKDWSHMLHAIPQLVSIYNMGVTMKKSPAFDDGWLTRVSGLLDGLQDSATGLWLVNGRPSIMATHLIASKSYRLTELMRTDDVARGADWQCADRHPLQNAELLCNSLMAAQCHDPANPQALAGWTRFAFQEQAVADAGKDRGAFEMASTAAAVNILAQCMPLLNDDMKARARTSIQGAWEYAMRVLVRPNGMVFQSDVEGDLRAPALNFLFFEGTQWLERRVNANLPAPEIAGKINEKDELKLTWKNPDARYVSLRVYAMANGLDEKQMMDENLAGVINRQSKNIKARDPLMAMQQICTMAEDMWGLTPEQSGANYIQAKMNLLATAKPRITTGADILVPKPLALIKEGVPVTYWVAAVTPYGEMSRFVKLVQGETSEIGAEEEKTEE